MEKDDLVDLMREFGDSPLSVLEVEDGDVRVRMEKPSADEHDSDQRFYAPMPPAPMGPPPMGGQPPHGPAGAQGPCGAPDAAPDQMPPQPPAPAASGWTAPAAAPAADQGQPEAPEASGEAVPDDDSMVEVTAPLVGVFYTSPTPGDPPYVRLGDHVEKGDVVCLVEAMKMINEIKAPAAGTVRKVLHEAGDAVGYDDVLMLIETDD